MNTDFSVDQDSTKDQTEQSQPQKNLGDFLTDHYNYQIPRRGDIREGTVVDIDEHGVLMDIGSKREGLVSAEDLSHLDEETRSEIKIGDSINVFVVQTADRDGRPVLSIQQARLYEDWIKAEQMMESGELYEGEISSINRGGVIVKFGKIRGFVPASQIAGLPRRLRAEQRRERLEAMIGQRIGVKIIEVNRQRRRLIFSQRQALRAWQELQRERIMAELVEGETRHGKITSITDFGAFVDLGGADGLIHVSELSWKRIGHPREILKVGDQVDVYVLNVDHERKRIALSLKQLQPDPWTLVDDQYHAGQLIEGRVTRVLDFGAFVELDLGVEGLLHAREMMGTPDLAPSDIVQPNETILVKIIRIDSRRRRLDLSAKQVRQGEWERWVTEHQAAQAADEAAAEKETAATEPEAGEEAATVEAAEEEETAATPEPAADEAAAEKETAATEPEADEEAATVEAAEEEKTAATPEPGPAADEAAAEKETAATEPEAGEEAATVEAAKEE